MSHRHRPTRRAFLELGACAAALTLARRGHSDPAPGAAPEAPEAPPHFSIGLIALPQYADQPHSGRRQ